MATCETREVEDNIKLSLRKIGFQEGIWVELTLKYTKCWISVFTALNIYRFLQGMA